MWVRAGYAETMAPLASASRDRYLTENGKATSGPAENIEARLKNLGERRLRLIELGNRARMFRQRSRASLIDATLRQLTMEALRLETRREG